MIGHLSNDLMVLWRKQAEDDCDDTLKSQKINADAVVWLQVVPMHIVQGNDTDKQQEDHKHKVLQFHYV